MQTIRSLTEEQKKNIIGQKYSEELCGQYDWEGYYPFVNDSMTIVDIMDLSDTWPNDIVIDAQNDYARYATTEEIAYHKEQAKLGYNNDWPKTVMQ